MERRLLLLTMAVLVGLLAWAVWPPPPSPVPPSEVRTTAGAAAVPRTAPSGKARADEVGRLASSTQPVDDRPFTEMRAELEQRADAGDARAALRLGVVLIKCNGYVPVSNEQLEGWLVNAAAGGMTLRDNGQELPPDEVLARMKANARQKQRDCVNVSGLQEPDADRLAFHWLERAATLGDADAQALYGAAALGTYTPRSALADAEGVRDRMRQARDYMDRSIAQGDATALLQT